MFSRNKPARLETSIHSQGVHGGSHWVRFLVDFVTMASAALKIGIRDLAEMADVTTATITRFENERGGLNTVAQAKLKAALEAAGVLFIDQNGNGPGVRLRDRQE